ncbi:MAG: hypothetical protein K6U89_18475 [Chloroflexi bacterium]|nr:hypothetical protein [Chloroflexota bacterium]
MAQEVARKQPRRVTKPRVTRRALEPFWLTRPEAEAKRLRRKGKTVRGIAKTIAARFTGAKGARLTTREQQQVKALHELDEERVHRTVREWLAKGKFRRRIVPPPPGVPVWVDLVRCVKCNRPEAVLRKLLTRGDVQAREQDKRAARLLPLLPSGDEGFGYCRTCKRYRRFRVVDSRRVPETEVQTLVRAWVQQPRLARSRFLLETVWGLARLGRVRRG